MGNHQSYPTDDATDRHTGRRNQRRADDDNHAQALGIDTQCPGFFIAQRKNVDFPAQDKDGGQSHDHRDGGQLDVIHIGTVKAAHEPVGDGGQLLLSIRDQFDE